MSRDSLIINILFPELLPYAFQPSDRRHVRNCNHLRSMFQEILNDRRSGKSKGVHSDGSEDLLSILMSSEFYHGKDNEMLDELSTFFVAGMKTV